MYLVEVYVVAAELRKTSLGSPQNLIVPHVSDPDFAGDEHCISIEALDRFSDERLGIVHLSRVDEINAQLYASF